jgi:hypothetical protein
MTIAPFVCLYTGPPGECCECGGYDPTGSGLCSFECVESRQAGIDRQDAERDARRAADDKYGTEVDRLRALGHTYEEIEQLLKDWP